MYLRDTTELSRVMCQRQLKYSSLRVRVLQLSWTTRVRECAA